MNGSHQPDTPTLDTVSIGEKRLVRLENYLPPADHEELLRLALASRSLFIPSGVTGSDPSYRRSSTLEHAPEFFPRFARGLETDMVRVCAALDSPNLGISGGFEMAITAHNDGAYFRVHQDVSDDVSKGRAITFVYYFHRMPRAFNGGDLVIYDAYLDANKQTRIRARRVIEPVDNMIVFFLPNTLHEVTKIACPSREFDDSRFTINGWLWHRSQVANDQQAIGQPGA